MSAFLDFNSTPTEFLLCWMQKIERRIRMILAFKELAIQWKRQAHQNALCPSAVSATPCVEDRQDVCGAPLFPVQAGCCSPQQADSPFSLGCLGMCPGQQFRVFHGYTVNHVAPPTLVSWSPKQSCMKFNCCEVTLLWASQVRRLQKSERCLASLQLFQMCQHRCPTCEKSGWEPLCWAQPTHRNMRDSHSTIFFKNLCRSL